MTPPDRAVVDRLFSQALDLPATERGAFLAEACGSDSALRDTVLQLLDAAEMTDDFLSPGGALRGPFGRTLDAPAPIRSPEHVGPFRIVREIGRGGMSVVYLAEREAGGFDQQVAVKLIRSDGDGEQVRRRFRQEQQILASLNHPGIARLLDGGWTPDGAPYFAMELIDGLPIQEHCRQQDLEVDERLALFAAVADAVAYAHARHVIHRDLKPSNILVDRDGRVRLLDFGIAKLLDGPADDRHALTRGPVAPLTLAYASPEQIEGGAVATASDVYQLGVLLYELLTDRRPYRVTDDAPQALARAICEQTPARPSAVARHLRRRLRGDLDVIVMMALRKDPARRYRSAAQLAEDVRRHLTGHAITARRDALAYRARTFLRRHAAGSAAAVVGVVGIGAFIGAQSGRRGDPGEARVATRSPQAYDHYLEAQHHFLQLGEGVQRAITLFERAVELDPEFGHAWAGLAAAYNMSRTFGPAPDNVDALIEASATRAIALNQHLGTAYMALGAVEGRRDRRLAAVALLHKALALSPDEPSVLNAGAELMLLTGHLQDALRVAQRLHEVNPVSLLGGYWVGSSHLMLGNFDVAARFCDRAWQQSGVRGPIKCSVLARIEKQDFEGAAAWVAELDGQAASAWARVTSAYLEARRLASADGARRAVDAIAAAVDAGELPVNDAFYYYATLGDLDRTFAALDTRLDRGQWVDTRLWWLPSLATFRQDPRFPPLAEREGAAEVWRAHGWPDACRPEGDRFSCR
jgi:serine/threonine-protein kinase